MTDFKVGDIVTFCEKDNEHWQGGKGRVTAVNEGAHPYEVLILEGPPLNTLYRDGGKTVNASSDWIKLLEPEEFKVGDIVKVKPGGFIYAYHENKTLIVDRLHDGKSEYRYGVRALGEDFLPGHSYVVGELEAGEELAEWEIELLDYRRPKLEEAKAAHPSNGKVEDDPVNNPSHYTQYPVEVIELTRHMPFDEGNVVKYVARAPFKGNKVQDLKKARFYLDDAIKLAEAELAAAE